MRTVAGSSTHLPLTMNTTPTQKPGVHYKSDVQKFLEDPKGFVNGLSEDQLFTAFTLLRMGLMWAAPSVIVPGLITLLDTSFSNYKTHENIGWLYVQTSNIAWTIVGFVVILSVYVLYLFRVDKLKAMQSRQKKPKRLMSKTQNYLSLVMVLFAIALTTKAFSDHLRTLIDPNGTLV